MTMRLRCLQGPGAARVSVVRLNLALVGGAPGQRRGTAYASVNVLLVPVAPKERDTPLGFLSQAKWHMTWCTEVLQNGDQVTVIAGATATTPTSAAGKTFVLHMPDDNSQMIQGDPFTTGFLIQGDF